MALPTKPNLSSEVPSPGTLQAAIAPSVSLPPGMVMNPEALAEMLFSTAVIYGPTGSWKTSQIGEFARYIYAKTGKKTRLISLDGGGWGPIQPEINAGIIDAWRLVEEENPKIAVIKASRGAWPEKLVNGLRATSKILEFLPKDRAKGLADVGAYAVEGWASISKTIMRDAVGKGQKISEDVVSKFTETSDMGSESFGAPAKAHYGFVQNFLQDMIRNFSALGVERVLYTSLEGKGEDRLTKQLTYGPETAGGALTAIMPAFVGDCLHFEDYVEESGTDPANPKQKLIKEGVRAWFVKHPDSQTGIMWPAKCRLAPTKVDEFRKRMGAHGYFNISKDVNFGTYLRLQDEMLASTSDDLRKWKEEMDQARKARLEGAK